ncbi:relaxase/mobilization nuclease domain-containing protein [Nitrospirillum viridazoti]|nr:relaxase/mobilization nuclease domain-containing protein [Nitrospirillum amazonense]
MMIEKISRGADVRGLLEYLLGAYDHAGRLRVGGAAVIGGTVDAGDIEIMTAEFRALQRLRPTITKAMVHCSLRLPAEEHLPDLRWARLGEKWANKMGFQAFAIVRHPVPAGDHIHLVASSVNPDGSVVDCSWDYRRGEAIVRDLERQFGLRGTRESHLLIPQNALNEAPKQTRGDRARARAGKRNRRKDISDAIDLALQDGPIPLNQLREVLWREGISLRLTLSADGRQLLGISFEQDGVAFRGGDIGPGYSLPKLLMKGIRLEWLHEREVDRSILEP